MEYNYETGEISDYAIKRTGNLCRKNENRTRVIGVMCLGCPFYLGLARKLMDPRSVSRSDQIAMSYGWEFVACTGFDKDDGGEIVGKIRSAIYDSVRDHALKALDY